MRRSPPTRRAAAARRCCAIFAVAATAAVALRQSSRGFVGGFGAAASGATPTAPGGRAAAPGGRDRGAIARRADAQDVANVALFFLWGSPAPLGFSAFFKRAEETLAAQAALAAPAPKAEPSWLEGLFAGLSGTAPAPAPAPAAAVAAGDVPEPRNMMWAFPSFGVLLEDPKTAPQGMQSWVRWLLVWNVWAAIIWYLYYKLLVEEELRQRGLGIGGYLVIVPFALGLAGGIYGEWTAHSLTATGDPLYDMFSSGFYFGFLWIYVNQFFLYQKVNKLYTDEGRPAPLEVIGLVIPGFNFVTGIRQIHFLAEYWARQRGETPARDAFTDLFPFCTKETLTFTELVTTPSLWIRTDRLTGGAEAAGQPGEPRS